MTTTPIEKETLDHYQKDAKKFLLNQFNSVPKTELIKYCTLGLNEEAGEVAGKVKKAIRDANGCFDEERVKAIILEMGDTLWYLAMLAEAFNIPLSRVASSNIEKLTGRMARNTIHGEGDIR